MTTDDFRESVSSSDDVIKLSREVKVQLVLDFLTESYMNDPCEARNFLLELYRGERQEIFPVSEWYDETLDDHLICEMEVDPEVVDALNGHGQ